MGKLSALALVFALAGCEKWEEEHQQRCTAWMQRARTASDSLHVEMTCAQLVATRKSEEAARLAAALGVMAVTSK